jgi:hypothetical protein
VVQRRGGRVNIPEIGSRDGEIVFGGILRFCAELRRELFWGNLDLGFLGILLGVPRGVGEEGGPLCAFRGIYLCVGLGGIGKNCKVAAEGRAVWGNLFGLVGFWEA